MRLTAAIRTRSDGAWHEGSHYGRLEIGREVMNSLTKVSKDTLVIEVNEQQTGHNEGEVQREGGAGGVVPQRKVEQCGGVAMPLSTGDPHQPHHGTRPEDNSDICTL